MTRALYLVVHRTSSVVAAGAILLLTTAVDVARAEDHRVQPRGEYAKIDTRLAREASRAFTQGSDEEKAATMAKIGAHPENYPPPVFYELSSVLFQAGEKDAAAFWFYAGQLRARFDANRCADVSARAAVVELNEKFGTPINQYSFANLAKLEALVSKVVEWDRKTPHRYDPRWINLHGMGAFAAALEEDGETSGPAPLSLPEAQWEAIAERTRSDYLAGFREALAEMKRSGR